MKMEKSVFNKLSVLTHLMLTALLVLYSAFEPTHNFDVVHYVGCVNYYEIQDPTALHEKNWQDLEAAIPAKRMAEITDNPYESTVRRDPKSFRQQLPLFQIKVLYTSLVWLMTKLGVQIAYATHMLSALAVALGAWVFFFTFRRHIHPVLLFLLPVMGLAIGMLDVATMSSPDGLAFLFVALIMAALQRDSKWLWLLLPFSVWVRSDLVVYVGMLAVLLALRGNKSRLGLGAVLVLAVVLYKGVNIYFGNYPYLRILQFSFIEHLTYPAETDVVISLKDYLKTLIKETGLIAEQKSFHFYTSFLGISLLLLYRRGELAFWKIVRHRQILVPVALLTPLYFAAHMLMYPRAWSRFFLGQYCIGVILTLVLLTKVLAASPQKNSDTTPE